MTAHELHAAVPGTTTARVYRFMGEPALEVIGEGARRRVATLRLVGERLGQHAIQVALQQAPPRTRLALTESQLVGAHGATGTRAQALGEQGRNLVQVEMLGRERCRSGQQLEQQHPERPDITRGGQCLALELFRTRVARRHRTGALGCRRRQVALAECLGDAEVDELDLAFAIDHHVRRLQVTVHDQCAMRGIDGVEHGKEQLDARTQGQVPRAAILVDRYAVDILHHHIGLPGGRGAAIQHARDARVFQRGQELPFRGRAQDRIGVTEHTRHDLDGDALHVDAVGALGKPDLAHAAGTK